MTSMKIHEQIAFLRRQKGLTQEQLANALGVTNQSVSKWESAQCCPDIQLLPQIAAFFGVSIDSLMGYRPGETLENLCLIIRRHMAQLPDGQAFEHCYKLAALLHELAISDGCKRPLHWKEGRNYSAEQVSNWGLSISNMPEGCTGRNAEALFFALRGGLMLQNPLQLKQTADLLSRLAQPDALAVLFALCRLTGREESTYVSAQEIAWEAALPSDAVCPLLRALPVLVKNEGETTLYRLDDRCIHLPALLAFLAP